jgi:transcriptional regulator with XRE-family HTH domain
MSETFSDRLSRAFDFATMAEIARRIGAPHATVRNYFHGRLPAPEVLMKIANETNVSLNWLLTGKGEMFATGAGKADIGKFLDQRIEEMIERKLAARFGEVQNLGSIDAPPAFDVEASIRKHNDPQKVMGEWFKHDGRRYPKDFGVVFFQGWETYSPDEKVEAVKDAKKVLDRTLKRK